MRYIFGLSALLSPLFVTNAYAHGGHLAEVAGHSHWLGLAAAAAAAAIAAALAKSGSARKAREKAARNGESGDMAAEAPNR